MKKPKCSILSFVSLFCLASLFVGCKEEPRTIEVQIGYFENFLVSDVYKKECIARTQSQIDEELKEYTFIDGDLQEKYTDVYFTEKALLICVFPCASGGGTINSVSAVKDKDAVNVTVDFTAGLQAVLSTSLIFLEVNAEDVQNINKTIFNIQIR